MADAEDKFKNLLSKQSKTLRDAVVEYRKRYGREPPKGFGDWWKFAQENNVRLVDEFNAIVEDLAPFWDMSPAEFRRRAIQVSHNSLQLGYRDHLMYIQVGEVPSIDLVRIVNGETEPFSVDWTSSERGYRAIGFMSLIEKFQHMVHIPSPPLVHITQECL